VEENNNLLILHAEETLVEGLRRLGQKKNIPLVSTLEGSCGCFYRSRYIILEGELGLCTLNGRTHFLPPGNYLHPGIGVEFHGKHIEDPENGDHVQMTWKEVTYVSLPEHHVAVVQEGDRQYVIPSGRYVMMHPTKLFGAVDVQDLKNKEKVKAITEEAAQETGPQGRESKDVQKTKILPAGEWEKVGAVTFIRAQPGFCYVVQNPQGQLRSGIGLYVCRGGEVFKQFVDRQHYARTTRTFNLESRDRQEVRLRVQLRWRLENAKLWLTRQGASTDIFDAIEEISQSLLRDAIAAHTYEECAQQAGEGYEGIEKIVRRRLESETSKLGGRLLGFEIRELRFPLLETRNRERADKEAYLNEILLEEKRQLNIEVERRRREDARLAHERDQAAREQEHKTKLQKLINAEALAKQKAEADLHKQKALADMELETARLEAARRAQAIQLNIEQEKAQSAAARRLIEKQSQAEEKVQQAEADAKAVLLQAEADAEAKIKTAQADAKKAELVGAAYRANPDYLKLEFARMNADVLKLRANAIADAISKNKGAMMPVEMQKELTFLDQTSFNTMSGWTSGKITEKTQS